jgi:hypothetical protein
MPAMRFHHPLCLAAVLAVLAASAAPAAAVVAAGGLNGNDKPKGGGAAAPGRKGFGPGSAPAPAPAAAPAAEADELPPLVEMTPPPAGPVWKAIDQTQWVKRDGLYDYATNTWVARNFKALPPQPRRFAEPNAPGGPRVPASAIADPDKFTFEAVQRKNHDAPKRVEQHKSPLRDEVPGLPIALIRTLETHLQPGDVLLPANDPADAQARARDQFPHGMLYLGRGLVVHAVGVPRETAHGRLKPSVFLSTLASGLQRDVDGADRLVVIRPRHTTQADFNRIVEFAVGEVGKPYDFALNSQDAGRYYGTELPLHAYKLMAEPIALQPDATLPLAPVTGNSFLAAMEQGDYDLVLVLNPKLKADTLKQ